MNDHSRTSLLAFLDYLSEKGLLNKNTVVARKAASNNMLSILDEREASDLRGINLDEVALRFANLKGSRYSGNSLKVYKSRVSMALEDFFRYKENPSNFKIGTTKSAASKGKAKVTTAERNVVRQESPSLQHGHTSDRRPAVQVGTINVPIALRPDCIAQVNGLPIDLTKAEAQKIANVILAMATETA